MLSIHVGLHKTAMNYFQLDVFPHWPSLNFVLDFRIKSFLKIDPNQHALISPKGPSGGVIVPRVANLTHLNRISRLPPDAGRTINAPGL